MFRWTDYTIIIHTLKLQQNQILASFWTRNLTKHQWLLLIQCLSEKYKTTFSMDPKNSKTLKGRYNQWWSSSFQKNFMKFWQRNPSDKVDYPLRLINNAVNELQEGKECGHESFLKFQNLSYSLKYPIVNLLKLNQNVFWRNFAISQTMVSELQ